MPRKPTNVESDIARLNNAEGTGKKKKAEEQPVFKVFEDSKIPVPMDWGKLWMSRRDIVARRLVHNTNSYKENCRYYRNDQSAHRFEDRVNTSGNKGSELLDDQWVETENLVFANARVLGPVIYSRNPKVEITNQDRSKEPQTPDEHITLLERLINQIFTKRETPGINLKPKVRRSILNCQMSNRVWAVIGWTFKEQSSEKALSDLRDLADKLEKAKNKKEIQRIEQEIKALQDKVDLLSPEGPWTKVKFINEVYTDMDLLGGERDLGMSNWLMYSDFLPTDYINAVYGERDGNKVRSIYKPTHIFKGGDSGSPDSVQMEIDNFTLFKDEQDKPEDYGFNDEFAFKQAQRTKVWFVWDKTTRRLSMFHDKDWKWPIWVWDDPYQLEEFFPAYELELVEDPAGRLAKGEVSYMLDQQDAVNEINSMEAKARRWAFLNIFYNKNLIDKGDVEAVLKGPDGTARGIAVPDGQKLSDHIFSMPIPALQYPELFNKDTKYQAVDRIQTVNNVLRGGQFKTNTTNDEVDFVRDTNAIQVEDKTDLVEDWIGRIGYGILQMCLKFMSKEAVEGLLGVEAGTVWNQIRSNGGPTRAQLYSLQVVGGSTTKPTSKAKKQEALQLGQTLGQFARATPKVVEVMLRVMERAFDEVTLTQEDLKELKESIQQQLQRGQPGANGQAQPGQGDPLQAMIQAATARGVPPEQAEQLIKQELNNQGAQ